MRLISDGLLSSIATGESVFNSRHSSLSSQASQDSNIEFSAGQFQALSSKSNMSSLQSNVPTSTHGSLKQCSSLPVLIRKDSYNEAVDSPGDLVVDETDGGSSGITFTVAEQSSPITNNGYHHSKIPVATSEFKKGRKLSVQNLESIKEEDRFISASSSPPDRANSSGQSPKLKAGSLGKSLKYNASAISSDV